MRTYTFYKTYTINIPNDNYIIISMRGFGPGNYLALDLNDNDLRVYSPYENKGLLSQRKLTNEEIASVLSIFNSKEYLDVPESNLKAAFDATEINITSSIQKREKHIHHTLPDDKIIKRIISLYDEFNRTTP